MELNGLQQPERLIHTPPNRQVIDSNLLNDAIRVYDEQTPESYARLLQQNPILSSNGLGGVS
jgi:hypothetical protein